MRLALFQPDIPQNTGTIMRLCSCFDLALDIIEPCGFALNDRKMRRAGMDYLEHLDITRHADWQEFYNIAKNNNQRIILLTTKTNTSYTDFKFKENDILLAGRESAGVPDYVQENSDASITIPMAKHARSINVALSCAIVLGEAIRQTKKPL